MPRARARPLVPWAQVAGAVARWHTLAAPKAPLGPVQLVLLATEPQIDRQRAKAPDAPQGPGVLVAEALRREPRLETGRACWVRRARDIALVKECSILVSLRFVSRIDHNLSLFVRFWCIFTPDNEAP